MLGINFLKEKAAANKHSDIYLRIIHWNCKIKLRLKYVPYIYFSYQKNKMCSCVTFCYSLKRFPGTFHIFIFPIKCIKHEVA